jgi:hypothetical protein
VDLDAIRRRGLLAGPRLGLLVDETRGKLLDALLLLGLREVFLPPAAFSLTPPTLDGPERRPIFGW